ncbi:MAG TPA: flagellar hook-length control protein FliK [Chloroflexota bacterium]
MSTNGAAFESALQQAMTPAPQAAAGTPRTEAAAPSSVAATSTAPAADAASADRATHTALAASTGQAATGQVAPSRDAEPARPDGDASNDPSEAAVQLASQALAAFMAAFVAIASQTRPSAEQPTADQAAPALAATGALASPRSLSPAATDLAALVAIFADRSGGQIPAAGELGPAGAALAQLVGDGQTAGLGADDLARLIAELAGADGQAAETTSGPSQLGSGSDRGPKIDQFVTLLTAIAGGNDRAPGAADAGVEAERLAAFVAQLGGASARPASATASASAAGPLPAIDVAAAAARIAQALTAASGVAGPASSAAPALGSKPATLDQVVAAAQSLAAVAEVGQQLKLASVSGSSQVTVRLNPESLGAVRLDVQRTDQGVSLQVRADTAAAREIVAANLDAIRGALRSAGIEVDDVQLSGPAAGPAAADAQPSGPPPAQEAPAAAPWPGSSAETAVAESEPSEPPAPPREAPEQIGGAATVAPPPVASGPAQPTDLAPASAAPARGDGSQLVRDIAQQIGLLGGQGKSDFQLQLNPESLGRLHVRLTMEDGGMTVRMTAQSSEARSAIESSLGQLRQSFQEQGIRVDRFVVVAAPAQFGQDNQHPRRSRGWVDRQRSTRQPAGDGDFAQALAAVGANRALDYRA